MESLSNRSSKNKAFIDANFLIYLNTCTDPIFCRKLRTFFLSLIKSYDTYTDILVIDEVLYISKKKYRVPYNITLNFIWNILKVIKLIPLSEEVFTELNDILQKYNLKPSDAIHLAAMKLEGINIIVSEDADYDKIKDVRRIWLSDSL